MNERSPQSYDEYPATEFSNDLIQELLIILAQQDSLRDEATLALERNEEIQQWDRRLNRLRTKLIRLNKAIGLQEKQKRQLQGHLRRVELYNRYVTSDPTAQKLVLSRAIVGEVKEFIDSVKKS